MEVRLNTRRKIKSLCQSLGLTVPETLADVFRKDLAQGILLHFWNLIERELNVVSLTRERPENLFQQFVRSGMKPAKALQMVGTMAIVESVGLRGLKSLIHPSIFYKLFKTNNLKSSKHSSELFYCAEIKRQLSKFEPINTCNFA